MKLRIVAGLVVVLSACAARGNVAEYTTPGVGTPQAGADCAAEELIEDGWTISPDATPALMRAEYGQNWLEANFQSTSAGYLMEIRTSDTDAAEEAAADLLEDCGT